MTVEPALDARLAPRPDAAAKASGATLYAADLPAPEGLLEVVLVRSPHPRARVVRVSTAEAVAAPGVAAVVTAGDLPDALAGRRVRDMPLLARDVVRFSGEPVAAVLAGTRREAESAAALVEVDYDELPPVLGAERALEGRPGTVHDAPWEYPGAVAGEDAGPNVQSVVAEGDRAGVAEALGRAAHAVSAVYRTPSGQHGYLEPHAWVAVPLAGGRRLRLWGTTKSPYRLRDQIVACLGLDAGDVEIEPVPLGGDFGGKGDVVDASLCAALARHTGRPVRLLLRSAEDLAATDARHPSVIAVRLGCDGSGRFVGLEVDAVFDGGAYAAAKPIPSVNLHGALECALGYRFPVFSLRSRVAYTNTLPKGHMRAPGAPQVVFAVESAVDELAAAGGFEPADLRRRNLLHDGDADAYGHRWPEARGIQTLDAALAAAADAGDGSLAAVGTGVVGTGVAVYARPTPLPQSTSLQLGRLPDGRLEVAVPIPETGTGNHAVVQVQLASALGVAPDTVVVRQVSTGSLPRDPGVGGSRVTVGMSAAVARLAEAWREGGGQGTVSVEVPAGSGAPALAYCAQVARVAVDPETGELRVLAVVTAVDVADIVRPRSHQLQIDGGTVMGFGFASMEDLLEDEGQVWASNLGEFRIPSAADVPALRTVLVTGGRGVGEANVKSVGELANVPTAAAIANAVFDATGVRIRTLPVTAEHLWSALQERAAAAAGAGSLP